MSDMRSCVVCGTVFAVPKQVQHKKKYCSRACLKRVARSKQYAKQSPSICEYCGKEFHRHTDKPQRFCSKRCGLLQRFNSPEYIASTPDRFWLHVQKGNGCWEWQAYQRKGGYGEFSIGGNYVLAHRYSWELHNGSVPDGLDVCHHCDNPACVRPNHLFLGTPADNARDMVQKARHKHGEAHVSAKLTESDIRAIRASSLGPRALSRLYGVSHTSISCILRRETWKHID